MRPKVTTQIFLGLLLGVMGTDVNTGQQRFTFGIDHLYDGLDIVALALGIFGVAEFLKSVNKLAPIDVKSARVTLRDMAPSWSEFKEAFPAMIRGTLVGSGCALIPGTGPTIASFVAYATEKKLSRNIIKIRFRKF